MNIGNVIRGLQILEPLARSEYPLGVGYDELHFYADRRPTPEQESELRELGWFNTEDSEDENSYSSDGTWAAYI